MPAVATGRRSSYVQYDFLLNYYYCCCYYINSVYDTGSPSYATGRVHAHHPLGQKSHRSPVRREIRDDDDGARTDGRRAYTRARTHTKYTHTRTRTRAQNDTRTRRPTKTQRTQHVTTDVRVTGESECLSGRLARSHSPRRHCSWAGTRRTASCPLSRKAAVTLKRGPRLLRQRSNRLYAHERRTMQYECARKRVRRLGVYIIIIIFYVYVHATTSSKPLPHGV